MTGTVGRGGAQPQERKIPTMGGLYIRSRNTSDKDDVEFGFHDGNDGLLCLLPGKWGPFHSLADKAMCISSIFSRWIMDGITETLLEPQGARRQSQRNANE
jgi:hypothetical protein